MQVASDPKDLKERGIQRKKAVPDRINSILKLNATPVSAHNANLNLEELQTSLLSKATSLSETALKVLHCKRDKLVITVEFVQRYTTQQKKLIGNSIYLYFMIKSCSRFLGLQTRQQRNIEDEIAKCDKCIQNIKGMYIPYTFPFCHSFVFS